MHSNIRQYYTRYSKLLMNTNKERRGKKLMKEFIFPYEKFKAKISEHFGKKYMMEKAERVLGGAQKFVYKITTQNGFMFVIYIWHETTSYFVDLEYNDIFTSCSSELFEINNHFMIEHGVCTPKLYYMDRTKEGFPFEYAYVEYIDGLDMDAVIKNHPERVEEAMASLKKNLDKMYEITNNKAGALNCLQSKKFSTVTYAFNGAKKNLNYLTNTDLEHKTLYLKAGIILNKIYGEIEENEEYFFVHYELGPNHVMVDENNVTYLIDIEGAKFFDIEMEYSFLKMRFGQNYYYLQRDNLDLKKMRFYLLWNYLGNISGAYQLLKKNYYDIDGVRGMISCLTNCLEKFCNNERRS